MQTYISLIIEFFKAGLFAIGGGLATIPFLKDMSENYGWFSFDQLTDMIAVSESTPGPIGVNMATFTGWNTSGVIGAILATFALVFPSIVVIAIISRFLQRFRGSKLVNNAFYALRPCSTGLIAGAMFPVLVSAVLSPILLLPSSIDSETIYNNFAPFVLYIVFTVACFFSEKRKKPFHPVIFIGAGAVLGIICGFFGIHL